MADTAPSTAVATTDGGDEDASSVGDQLNSMAGRGDIMMAIGVVAILVILILPLPTWLMDFGLAISINFSVRIRMTGLCIERP